MIRTICLVVITAAFLGIAGATRRHSVYSYSELQAAASTLQERLGHQADAKLLIVHADDLGMAHSVNAATIKAFESGLVNSGSIMVPCPWLPEIAAYAQSHPEADLGLHLTLTSEWRFYRWGPVLPKDRVTSLLDNGTYLYPTETEAAARIKATEVESEIRAQIDRARAFGIKPTHLDSHMGTLYQNKTLFEILLRVGRDNKLPILLPKDMLAASELSALLTQKDIVIDRMITIGPNVPADGWSKFYSDAIKNLRPGVTELIVHIAYDDEEMRGATVDHPDWGAAWRQRDFEFLTSATFRSLLKENNIKLVTWREIGRAQYAER